MALHNDTGKVHDMVLCVPQNIEPVADLGRTVSGSHWQPFVRCEDGLRNIKAATSDGAHQALETGGLRAVASIDAQLGLQVLHNHVDNQGPIQLHIVQALILEVGAKRLARLLCILKDLLLGVL